MLGESVIETQVVSGRQIPQRETVLPGAQAALRGVTIYLSIYLSLYLPIYLSIYLYIYIHIKNIYIYIYT